MPRVHTVKSARKDQPTSCVRCHKRIVVGQGYRHASNRIGRMSITKRIHVDCGSFKRSELTTSEKLGMLYDAQDTLHSAVDAWKDEDDLEDLRNALDEAAGVAEEVAGMYQESLDNMPEGLQQGPTGEQIQESGYACEGWQSELESASSDLEEFDGDEARVNAEANLESFDSYDDKEQYETDVALGIAEARNEWAEEQREKVRNAADSLEL